LEEERLLGKEMRERQRRIVQPEADTLLALAGHNTEWSVRGRPCAPMSGSRVESPRIEWWEEDGQDYLRIPRLGLFNCCCRFFVFLRFGLLIMNVPEPM